MSNRRISRTSARTQLQLFLSRAQTLDGLTAADLVRRYNVPLHEIETELGLARQRRGTLL